MNAIYDPDDTNIPVAPGKKTPAPVQKKSENSNIKTKAAPIFDQRLKKLKLENFEAIRRDRIEMDELLQSRQRFVLARINHGDPRGVPASAEKSRAFARERAAGAMLWHNAPTCWHHE